MTDKVVAKDLELLLLLADTIVHETSADVIKNNLHPDFPMDRLDEYLKTYTKPSDIPNFIEVALQGINRGTTDSIKSFRLLFGALDSKLFAPVLTNSLTSIRDMTDEQRAALLRSWRDSPIEQKRRLFRVVFTLTVSTFVKCATDLHNKAAGYIGKENREKLYDTQVLDSHTYKFIDKPKIEGHELYLPNFDVLIIGSGVGAGAVANTVTEAGFTSLVLEKGKYFTNDQFQLDDSEGSQLFEQAGTLPSVNQQVVLVAGSTFGGGSTVNWSACLKTPFKVREEWYKNHGLDFVASQYYDDLLQYGWDKMGASQANVTHSFSNQVVLDGAAKLGYKARPIEQNTGGHQNHDCGMCHLGCKFGIKQGGINCWFREPCEKGTQFMEQVKVLKILHKNGKAIGVLARDEQSGIEFKITGPKKIVVSGGSINTPLILQKSGFKNKHIGSNLKVHPVSAVFGDFGNDVDMAPYNKSIMTSVCNEVEDLDGKYHGTKIETLLHVPFIESLFLPWESSDQLRTSLLKYKQYVALLLLNRDTGSGSITYDKSKPDAISFDYVVNKTDRKHILQAFLIGADILYIEGAKEIISPQAWVPIFKSDKPKHARNIKDEDYVNWRNKVAKIPFDSYGSLYGSAHQMSSCRMSGKGPSDGAVDLKGKLYECSNVYVADASIMPTASGANPMITTIALSRHVALNLVKDLQPQPKI